jgi:hypothetical protein
MNKSTNSVEINAGTEAGTRDAKPLIKQVLSSFESYRFVAPHWICAKCRDQIDKWHNAIEVLGLMIHHNCGGRYLPSEFYYYAMGESCTGTPAAAPDHGMHSMHDDWLVTS